MASILEDILSHLSPDLISSAASTLGESETAVGRAVRALAPTILSGMLGKADDQDAWSTIFGMLNDDRTRGFLDDLGGLVGGGNLAQNDPKDAAGSLMGVLFGEKVEDILGGVERFAGLGSRSSASSLLGLAGPLVMGFLGRKIKSAGLSAAGLGSLLRDEKETIDAAVPHDIAALFAGPAAQPAPQRAPETPRAAPAGAAAAADERSTGGFGWLWPLLGLLALALLLWKCVGGDRNDGVDRENPAAVERGADVTEDTDADASSRPDAGMADATDDETAARDAVDTALDETRDAARDAADGAASVAGAFSRTIGEFEITGVEGGVESQLIAFIESGRDPCTDAECWFSFDRLTFNTGSASLDMDKSRDQLANIYRILQAYPDIQLKLGGYTDNTGSEEFNMQLSQDRADAVAAALVALGAGEDRLVTEGYGAQFPVASNDTEEGRAQNRRIDVRLRRR